MKKIAVLKIVLGLLFFSASGSYADEKRPLIIDVRTAREFQRGHVDGALNIPYQLIAQQIAKHETDKTRNIVLYCASGARSGAAKRELINCGYTKVTNGGSLNQVRRAYPKK